MCRKGRKDKFKCIHGCIILNNERARKREEEREDYIQGLLQYVDEQEQKKKI